MAIIYYAPQKPKAAPSSILFYDGGAKPPLPAGDRLLTGQQLPLGSRLTSANGAYYLAFQASDNNLVLYTRDNQAYWSPNVAGRGAVKAVQQSDGNFVLYDAAGRAVWDTGSHEHPGAFIAIQNDGNLVVYAGNAAVWDSRTVGGHYHPEDSWLKKAAQTAGRGLAGLSHEFAEGISDLEDLAAMVPLVGPALDGVLRIVTGPITFTDSMLQGERIDHALLDDLKNKVAAYREIAPYAQAVVSLVPGLGSGVAAGIAASAALANGMPIDQALVEGIKGALPGGSLARATLSLTYAAATGENLIEAGGQAAIDAAGLPPQAKNALDVIYRASKGENIPKAVLANAYAAMPTPELQHAVQVGVALALGKRIQDATLDELKNIGPDQLGALRDAGEKVAGDVPAFQAAVEFMSPVRDHVLEGFQTVANVSKGFQGMTGLDPAQEGYHIGLGLMSASGVNEAKIAAIRSKLSLDQAKGFDMGVSSHIAAVISKPAPVAMPPKAQAGYLVTQGMQSYPVPDQKAAMMYVVAQVPEARAGAVYAIQQINAAKPGFWNWFKRLIGV
jgi:hypothetical protein